MECSKVMEDNTLAVVLKIFSSQQQQLIHFYE